MGDYEFSIDYDMAMLVYNIPMVVYASQYWFMISFNYRIIMVACKITVYYNMSFVFLLFLP